MHQLWMDWKNLIPKAESPKIEEISSLHDTLLLWSTKRYQEVDISNATVLRSLLDLMKCIYHVNNCQCVVLIDKMHKSVLAEDNTDILTVQSDEVGYLISPVLGSNSKL